MNFNETLGKLRDMTQRLHVYAMYAYNIGGSPSVGVRASYYGDPNDPVVDNNIFMIYGDIFKNPFYEKIQHMEELKTVLIDENKPNSLSFELRADLMSPFPLFTTIQLGSYEVVDFEIQKIYRPNPYAAASLERVMFNLERVN